MSAPRLWWQKDTDGFDRFAILDTDTGYVIDLETGDLVAETADAMPADWLEYVPDSGAVRIFPENGDRVRLPNYMDPDAQPKEGTVVEILDHMDPTIYVIKHADGTYSNRQIRYIDFDPVRIERGGGR